MEEMKFVINIISKINSLISHSLIIDYNIIIDIVLLTRDCSNNENRPLSDYKTSKEKEIMSNY